MTEHPHRYSIAELLNSGIQPFTDLPEDELEALGKAIGKGPLLDPVTLSGDGILLDGHQRLKAMLAQGRKFISADDVRIAEKVTKANAYEYAIRLNVQRRHLSVVEKADLARRLQRERKWSQGKIADLFGVSRPAVSQWLSKTADTATDDNEEEVGYVVSKNGQAQPAKVKKPKPMNAWESDGYAWKQVGRTTKTLAEPLGGLGQIQLANVARHIQDLIEAAETLQNEIAEELNPPTSGAAISDPSPSPEPLTFVDGAEQETLPL